MEKLKETINEFVLCSVFQHQVYKLLREVRYIQTTKNDMVVMGQNPSDGKLKDAF